MPDEPKIQREAEALDEVEASRNALDTSRTRWTNAVLAAKKLNISNVRIAGRSGVTEAAIRLLVTRALKDKK